LQDRLAAWMEWYVHDRLSNNPAWRGVKVIFSDGGTPGEVHKDPPPPACGVNSWCEFLK